MSTYVHIYGHQAIFTFSERYQFLMLWKHQKMRSFETGKGETEDESQKQPTQGGAILVALVPNLKGC
jgi:hypothetical protein